MMTTEPINFTHSSARVNLLLVKTENLLKGSSDILHHIETQSHNSSFYVSIQSFCLNAKSLLTETDLSVMAPKKLDELEQKVEKYENLLSQSKNRPYGS